jgi:hypothetical protein
MYKYVTAQILVSKQKDIHPQIKYSFGGLLRKDT